MQIPHDSYVLVADGQKMLFFRNQGDEVFPNLEVVSAAEHPDAETRDQGTDEPGRSAAGGAARASGMGVKAGRSAYSETDFHTLEEQHFAADAAEMLKKRALANEFEKLLIVAPPSTLGDLRKHYHKEIEQRLIGEIPKDLTNHPVSEIEKIISES
ncbi:host attachment family protein [Sphingomonas tabacisoli]|uniref:Host attachment family protein n=1 Tax=Sphingomonas tabacisoli TaxID=2249466 RepID=A0ABW4I233_9SPHN